MFAYAKGNYDFDNLEQIEDFVVFKGAYKIASYIQNDDAPCKTENYAILGYCLEYCNDNPYITEFLEKIYSPQQLASFQGPMEGDIAETMISLDGIEEESEEQKEDPPPNDGNSSTLTLFDCPPCLPKEKECYIFECHDSIEISTFNEFEITSSLTQEEENDWNRTWLPNLIYDNSLDDGPILHDDINFTTIVQSGFGNLTVF